MVGAILAAEHRAMLAGMQVRSIIVALLASVLAACSTFQGGSSPEGNIVSPSNFRAGSGVISSVAMLPKVNNASRYRVALQMDNGGYQQVDVDNAIFMAGQAVELTNDGRIVLVSGTTINQARGR
jgi:hypothetical protein